MVNILIAYILGLATGVIFFPLINSSLDKLFNKNK